MLYTTPAAETAVIRSFVVCNTNVGAVAVRIDVDPAGAAPAAAWWEGSVPAGGATSLPYLVLNPGDAVKVANLDAVRTVTATIVGSELEGAAD